MNLACKYKRGAAKILPWQTGRVYVPGDCQCNVRASIFVRVLRETVKCDLHSVLSLASAYKWMTRKAEFVSELSYRQWVLTRKGYTEGRRAELLKVCDQLDVCHELLDDHVIKLFIKKEVLLKPSAPRAIQPTSDRYLIKLGRYLAPIDKRIVFDNQLLITKGHDYVTLGRVFGGHLEHFADPVVVEVDFVKFDAHVPRELLEIEFKAYLAFNGSEEFSALLSKQLETKGRAPMIRYHKIGGRNSGCPNTSIGNCMANAAMQLTIAESLGAFVRVMVDGDDSLVLIERAQSKLWAPELYTKYGFEAKLKICEIWEASYCSGNFMPTNAGYVFVRALPRALRKLPWSLNVDSKTAADHRAHDKLHADLHLMPAVPVFSVLLDHWHSKYKCRAPESAMLSYRTRSIESDFETASLGEIQDVSRNWFSRVYGKTKTEQLMIEQSIRKTGWHEWLTYVASEDYTEYSGDDRLNACVHEYHQCG